MEILKGLYGTWMRFARAVGTFNSRLLFSFVYFLLISPVALFFKLFSRDRLETSLKEDRDTYWVKRSSPPTEKDRYEKQY